MVEEQRCRRARKSLYTGRSARQGLQPNGRSLHTIAGAIGNSSTYIRRAKRLTKCAYSLERFAEALLAKTGETAIDLMPRT